MRGAAGSEGKGNFLLQILYCSLDSSKLQGMPLCADTTRWQIALIWMEVIKSCKLDLWLELGGSMRVKASDLGPVLRLKQAG